MGLPEDNPNWSDCSDSDTDQSEMSVDSESTTIEPAEDSSQPMEILNKPLKSLGQIPVIPEISPNTQNLTTSVFDLKGSVKVERMRYLNVLRQTKAKHLNEKIRPTRDIERFEKSFNEKVSF